MKARKDYVRLGRTGKRFFFSSFIAQALPIHDRVPLNFDIVLVARSRIFDLDFTDLQKEWSQMLGKLENNQEWSHEEIRR